jgi:hypothetical protein
MALIEKSDLMGAAELRDLLNVSTKTLTRYRQKHWHEGIHYVKPIQRILYIRPMILDWILNHKTNPLAHQDAMTTWVARTQGRASRKAS